MVLKFFENLIIKIFGKIEYFGVFVLSLLYVFLNSFALLNGINFLIFLPVGLIIIWLVLFHSEKALLILAFIVPLSIPLSRYFPQANFNLSLPSELFLITFLLLFLLKVLLEGEFDKAILTHPVTLAILFYLSWMAITSTTSEMPVVSYKYLLAKIWFIVTFYFLATQLFIRFKNIPRYIWYYSIGLLIVIILAVSQLIAIDITSHKVANRVVRPFYNDHTDYAAAIAMILVFTVGYFALKRKKASNRENLFYLSLVGLFFIALVLSYTRAAWISLVIALGFFIGMKLKIRLRTMFMLLAIIVGLIIFMWTDIARILEKNKQDSSGDFAKHITSITNITTDASNLERINRWACAIRMFAERPIFGWGPGTYQFQYAPFQKKAQMTVISTRRGDIGNAHSEYLGALSEMGLVGALSFIAILITTMYTASKLYFKAKRRKVRVLAITLLIALFSYYAHGILNNFLDTDKLSALFWAFTAAIVALDVYHTPKLKKE